MINAQQTVAGIAANSFAAVRIFSKHGIDFCCGGHRPLAEVCLEKQLSTDALIAELESGIAGAAPDETDWNTAPLSELVRHIVARHHEYLRAELPRIQGWLDRVYAKYGEQDAGSIGRLPEIFNALRAELEMHLMKEEAVLFPAVVRMAAPCGGSFDGPIAVMEMEHEHAGAALRAMRELTGGYTAPDHACRTYRALFEALAELEADLHLHIHLENNILFPRVQQLTARV